MMKSPATTRNVIASIMLAISSVGLSNAGEPIREQLPTGMVPMDYALDLQPDMDTLTFKGKVKITLQVNAASPGIVLNSKGLEFDSVTLDDGQIGSVALDPKLERASFKFAQPVAIGQHTLTISYHGLISHGTFGLFAMDYKTGAKSQHTLATNFEPAGERQLMPSWDEPGYKATFTLTVDAPVDRVAVSNMPIESIDPVSPTMQRVHFYRSPKMSTYLMFLTIGDYERITAKVGDTELGVVVKRGDTKKAQLALTFEKELISYYNSYFGVPYPLPKLDLIAAPGSIEGDSMENWGANFYTQSSLLFDPDSSTDAERQRVFLVVSHEMAHQWFGDLVTMTWWDNLWLNEGFARWMQTKAAVDLHPEWKTDLQAMRIVEAGKRADASPSTHPVEQPVNNINEALEAFDNITYDKGATVIRMIEEYIGADGFRGGVRIYMKKHAYGSTVSDDLWLALEQSSGKSIRDMAHDFTLRSGLPLIALTTDKNGVAKLTQGQFPVEPTAPVSPFIWHMPLSVQSIGSPDSLNMLFDTATHSLDNIRIPLLVNAGQTSYARVHYDQAGCQALAQHFSDLAAIDQIGVLQDAWALAQTGTIPVDVVFDLVNAIPVAADPLVWSQGISILSELNDNFAGLSVQARLKKFARARLNPVLVRVGWDTQANELATINTLRPQLIIALSQFDDQAVINTARQRFAAVLNNQSKLGPDAGRIAEDIVAQHADAAMFTTLINRIHSDNDPLIKEQRLFALTNVANPALAAKLLQFTLGPDIPAGEAPMILAAVGANHPDLAWAFTMSHFNSPELMLDVPGMSTRREVLATVANSTDLSRINEIKRYGKNHLPAGDDKTVTNTIYKIRMRSTMALKYSPQAAKWLAHNAVKGNE